LRNLRAVEIRHFARADDIELKNLEICLDVVGDLLPGKIDEMCLLAIGTSFQLRHDCETFAVLAGGFQVVAKLEKAFVEPRLLVEAIVGEDRRRTEPAAEECQSAGSRNYIPPRYHCWLTVNPVTVPTTLLLARKAPNRYTSIFAVFKR